ncbi:MAG: hypothetical protein JXQ75_14150 [Phycisphaerae bacterium]|nr:hypothetical protein [Phycisphaerae bacterium]
MLLVSCPGAHAQFLRLGPFDFDAATELEGVYTTNVEGERESEATAEMKDFYFIAGLNLNGVTRAVRNTTIDLTTAMSWEKHLEREDLDNTAAPFGLASVDSKTEFSRYSLGAYAEVSRTYESKDDVYVPGQRKTRDESDNWKYGANLRWRRDPLEFSGEFKQSSERHKDEDFKDGDEDKTGWVFDVGWSPVRRLTLGYSYEREKTEYPYVPTNQTSPAEADWEVTERATIDWILPILERPSVTYSIGLEKEDTETEKGDWEVTHRVGVSDMRDITSPLAAVSLAVSADYQYEKDPEEDDVSFTYGAEAIHELSRTAKQRLSAKREPVETFGSTADTDTTTLQYGFTKQDLFMYYLDFAVGTSYEIAKPAEDVGDTEKTWTYGASLSYSRKVSRKLQRKLTYSYQVESSNLEDEDLEEHRVTLSYMYTF